MSERLSLSVDDDEKRRRRSEEKFNEFVGTCFDEGWFPTKCSEGCIVEPDGVCPHGFESIALELGLI